MFWYSRKTGFPKIKILPELRDDSRLGQCSWTITNIAVKALKNRIMLIMSRKSIPQLSNAEFGFIYV